MFVLMSLPGIVHSAAMNEIADQHQMLDWYPPTFDDVGPLAKVGGVPPGRVWGSGSLPGTSWMVLRG